MLVALSAIHPLTARTTSCASDLGCQTFTSVVVRLGPGQVDVLDLRQAHPGMEEEIQHLLHELAVDRRRRVAVRMLREPAAPEGDVVLALDAPGTAVFRQAREVLRSEGREIVAAEGEEARDIVGRLEPGEPAARRRAETLAVLVDVGPHARKYVERPGHAPSAPKPTESKALPTTRPSAEELQ